MLIRSPMIRDEEGGNADKGRVDWPTELSGSLSGGEASLLKKRKLMIEERFLLDSISAEQKKREGIFFTPETLSKLAMETFGFEEKNGPILDPACGTGNLLLEVARELPIAQSLSATLKSWNRRIFGLDINSKFIRLTKIKIASLAVERGAELDRGEKLSKYITLLSNIRTGDFTKEYARYAGKVGGVLMNPPFCQIETPSNIKWTAGKSNAAALFTYLAARIIPAGGKIVAILPDVLRSGSRYSKLRFEIEKGFRCCSLSVGGFEKGVQVDVFILSGEKRESLLQLEGLDRAAERGKSLSDIFDVSVGPVVPHRDKVEGPELPFAHAKIIPPWTTLRTLADRIRHSGRKVRPPFIAVRRTSSPKDNYRVVSAIIDCDEEVAVENHILILQPKDRSLGTCQRYMDYLRSDRVNEYINTNIRCRHLTVGVIKNIPIEE